MTKIFLKPNKNAEGAVLAVIDPLTNKALPEDGAYVTDSIYWKRRLADGDVEQTDAPDKSAAKKPAKKQATE